MNIKETERLKIRELTIEDAEFILKLLNEPSWLKYIGDKSVRTIKDAEEYIKQGPIQMYNKYGFGLYLVLLKENNIPIGMCGLIKRDYLDDADIGFAFLPKYWGQNYAYESAIAVINYGRDKLGLKRLLAITTLDNISSIKLLEKIGFIYEKNIKNPSDQNDLKLFRMNIKNSNS